MVFKVSDKLFNFVVSCVSICQSTKGVNVRFVSGVSSACQLWTADICQSVHGLRVYLGAAPRATLGAAGTSVPSTLSSSAVCASHTRSSRRTASRRPRWPAADTGRSSAASGSKPRFPCRTRTPSRRPREKSPVSTAANFRLNFGSLSPSLPSSLPEHFHAEKSTS